MIVHWLTAISDLVHRGYNVFFSSSAVVDTVGPTIVYGITGR